MPSTRPGKSSWSWCRRATWPNGSAPPGAGIGGFFTPTGYGTMLAEGKETRIIDGRGQVFETPIHADVALIKALKADGVGNLVYRKTARNFGPIMAAAAKHTIVQVSEIVPTGGSTRKTWSPPESTSTAS